MANMGYCRFQNTAGDLADCLDHINDRNLSDEEEEARRELIDTCRQILERQQVVDYQAGGEA